MSEWLSNHQAFFFFFLIALAQLSLASPGPALRALRAEQVGHKEAISHAGRKEIVGLGSERVDSVLCEERAEFQVWYIESRFWAYVERGQNLGIGIEKEDSGLG